VQALCITIPSPDAATSRVVELDTPVPGPGQLAVEVKYAGINFIDVMARRGDPGYATDWPYIPGLEVAGIVTGLGDGVEGHRIGDRVAALTNGGGGLAETVVVNDTLAVKVPDSVPLHVAAAVPLMLSSAVMLVEQVAHVGAGESVLLHSASGGIGTVVAQVAKAAGSGLLVGTVGSENKIAAALAAGWDHVVVRDDQAAGKIREAVPDGVDVILDPTGTLSLDLDLEVSRPGTRVVLFGNPSGGAPAPLPPLGRFIGANLTVSGFSMSGYRRQRPLIPAAALARSLQLLASNQVALDVTVIDELVEAPATHDLLAARKGVGKYVIQLSKDA
jgi:NADPH:quinone reductase